MSVLKTTPEMIVNTCLVCYVNMHIKEDHVHFRSDIYRLPQVDDIPTVPATRRNLLFTFKDAFTDTYVDIDGEESASWDAAMTCDEEFYKMVDGVKRNGGNRTHYLPLDPGEKPVW
jgi:hypothetical protein